MYVFKISYEIANGLQHWVLQHAHRKINTASGERVWIIMQYKKQSALHGNTFWDKVSIWDTIGILRHLLKYNQ